MEGASVSSFSTSEIPMKSFENEQLLVSNNLRALAFNLLYVYSFINLVPYAVSMGCYHVT